MINILNFNSLKSSKVNTHFDDIHNRDSSHAHIHTLTGDRDIYIRIIEILLTIFAYNVSHDDKNGNTIFEEYPCPFSPFEEF